VSNIDTGASSVLSDIQPPEKALALMKGFSPQSTKVFTEKVTYDAYRHIPVSYIFCERDNVLLPWWQEGRIEFLKNARADGQVKVVKFDTGHCPNISEPEAAAKKVLEAL
jgi:pimeloyl-ACP methyl ester carboxylesterase